VFYISLFFSCQMNNFVPNFILASKVSIVVTYESENNKIYPMWAKFYQWPKIHKNLAFKKNYIPIRHLVLVRFMHFIHIST
jgi:hypothetical protein